MQDVVRYTRQYSGHKSHFFPHPQDLENPFSSQISWVLELELKVLKTWLIWFHVILVANSRYFHPLLTELKNIDLLAQNWHISQGEDGEESQGVI